MPSSSRPAGDAPPTCVELHLADGDEIEVARIVERGKHFFVHVEHGAIGFAGSQQIRLSIDFGGKAGKYGRSAIVPLEALDERNHGEVAWVVQRSAYEQGSVARMIPLAQQLMQALVLVPERRGAFQKNAALAGEGDMQLVARSNRRTP